MQQPPQSKREHLRRLIASKQQWSEPLADDAKAIGFKGWHERGYLPHFDAPNVTQFVTFLLRDAFPVTPAARVGTPPC